MRASAAKRAAATGGLRHSQKRERQERILKAASALFRRKTFDDTTVEEIAETAQVSPGTVFNYYGSKVNILLSLIEIDTKSLVAAAQPKREAGAATPEAVCEYLARLTEVSLSQVAPAAWRHIYSTLVSDAGSDFAFRYRALQAQLVAAIASLLEEIVEGREIAKTIDISAMARSIYRIHTAAFIELISGEAPDFDAYFQDIDRHVGTILDVIAKAP